MKKTETFVCIILFFSLILIPFVNADDGNSNASVTQLWKFTSDSESFSSPVVADGFVYTTSWNTLYCIDASTGTQVWSRNAWFIRFTVANGYVYLNEVPQGNSQGDVACLNAFNGAEKWKFTYATSLSSPVILGNYVYVSGYAGPYPDSNHGFVYALDAYSGKVIWQYTMNSRADSVAVSGNLVYVNFHNENYTEGLFYGEGVCALDATTGNRVWNIPSDDCLNRVQRAPPIIQSNKVYLSYNNYTKADSNKITGGGVYALDALNGTLLWNFRISTPVSLPNIADGVCYIVANDSSLYALDNSNGAVIWNYNAQASLNSPLFVNGYLFIGSSDGVLCLNAANGEMIWNFNASDYSGSSATNPTYADGVIYVGWSGPMFFSPVTQHNFYALNAVNGYKLWNYTLGYTGMSSSVVDGTVYIGASWVTTRSPDNVGLGAVVALKSNVASLPLTTPPPASPNPSLTSTPTLLPTSTPTVPDLSSLAILSLFLSMLFIGVILRHRKNSSQNKPNI